MKGLVYKSTGNWYDVHTESNVVYKCNIKGKFRSLGIKSTNPVAAVSYTHLTLPTNREV